jgi:threonylcarbamoyladenosine tRNA methylthiotransferase MtaB
MVQRVGFAKLHVFPFSARAGTPAAEFGQQLGEAEKRQRSAALRAAGRAEREAFIRGQLGRVQAVLVETGGSGWSSNYIRVRVDGAQEGEVHELRLTAACIAES